MRFPVLLFFCSFVAIAKGQVFEGVVVNSITNEPLPYSNVGILNKNVGTVTDDNGAFKLDVSKMSPTDTIRISYIGYETIDILGLNADSEKAIIRLKPREFQLPEVQIVNRKSKTFIEGNTVKWDRITYGYMSEQLGAEFGTLIKLNKPALLGEIRFHIVKTTLDSLVLRVNVYDVVNGMPCNNLLKEPIIIRPTNVAGDVSIDLSEYNIVLEDDFVICLENFKKLGNNISGIKISAGMFNDLSYQRLGSQGKWNKIRFKKINVGVGLNVKMIASKSRAKTIKKVG